MEPSPRLVLATAHRINQFLKTQNQNESYVSEYYVFNALKAFMHEMWESRLGLSEDEIVDRVSTKICRKILSVIVTEQRWQEEGLKQALMPLNPQVSPEPHLMNKTIQFRIENRPDASTLRQRKMGNVNLPDRHIEIN